MSTADETKGAASRSPSREQTRIPLNTFAISLGLTGLALLWSNLESALALPAFASIGAFFGAALAWLWLIVSHTVRGARSKATLRSQLEHPVQGPIAAVVPIVGMLLGTELYRYWPAGGAVLGLVSLAVGVVFGAWILAFWHRGRLAPESLHGAYLLPIVGTGLIASTTASALSLPLLAAAAFAVGIFFWLVLITVLLARLAFLPPLPDELAPTLAILLAPPAIGGFAWSAMTEAEPDVIGAGFLGLLGLMVLMQLFLLGVYRRLAFSLGFWSFSFPVAAAAGYLIRWCEFSRFAVWEAVAVLLAGTATVLILAIGVRSLILVSTGRRGARNAEQSLQDADDGVDGVALSAGRGRRLGASPPMFTSPSPSELPATRRRWHAPTVHEAGHWWHRLDGATKLWLHDNHGSVLSTEAFDAVVGAGGAAQPRSGVDGLPDGYLLSSDDWDYIAEQHQATEQS